MATPPSGASTTIRSDLRPPASASRSSSPSDPHATNSPRRRPPTTVPNPQLARQVASSGNHSKCYFGGYGDLNMIRRLRFWFLDSVLIERGNGSKPHLDLVPIRSLPPDRICSIFQLVPSLPMHCSKPLQAKTGKGRRGCATPALEPWWMLAGWIMLGVIIVDPDTRLPWRHWHRLRNQQGDLGEGSSNRRWYVHFGSGKTGLGCYC
ncbi:putative protein kinase superfamily protein [Panicum miliaceum]|uniref:Uncharacterized protein n=1 Tax=Panicum miliaceum TaxID=4540 RepID=A0A3L6TT02_PANMI|nr:putative protein kinase superfamily protein [Panicum miliaceum]